MVYSNKFMLFVNFHYLQFSIKCNISIADEQKYIPHMSAINIYV